MSRPYSIADARKKLPTLVRQAESGEPVLLMRRGEPVAVLISTEQYAALRAQRADLWSNIENFRREVDLDELNIAAVYENVRDESPGRDVEL